MKFWKYLMNFKFSTLIKIAETAQTIKDSELEVETKYDLIFSENISRKFFAECKKLGINFEYYDPDTSYEEDIIAFVNAVSAKAQELSKLENKTKLSI